jgi:hypothetical protein
MTKKTISADQLERATEMVREAVQHGGGMPSEADRRTMVTAIAEDLDATAETDLSTEARLTKVEAQTQVLAEAVIAISEVPVGIAPTIEAVKAEM